MTNKSRKINEDLLDILYRENLIEERHYLIAMKFRWFYSKVFGNSQIKAYDFGKIPGKDLNLKEEWYEKIALTYQYIRKILVKEKYYQKIFDLCILNITPKNVKNINDYSQEIREALLLFEKILIKLIIERKRKFTYNNSA